MLIDWGMATLFGVSVPVRNGLIQQTAHSEVVRHVVKNALIILTQPKRQKDTSGNASVVLPAAPIVERAHDVASVVYAAVMFVEYRKGVPTPWRSIAISEDFEDDISRRGDVVKESISKNNLSQRLNLNLRAMIESAL